MLRWIEFPIHEPCFQWLIGIPQATTFIGCIGNDKYGAILADKTKEAGVEAVYQYKESEPTGTCAVLITGKNRWELCTDRNINNIIRELFYFLKFL